MEIDPEVKHVLASKTVEAIENLRSQSDIPENRAELAAVLGTIGVSITTYRAWAKMKNVRIKITNSPVKRPTKILSATPSIAGDMIRSRATSVAPRNISTFSIARMDSSRAREASFLSDETQFQNGRHQYPLDFISRSVRPRRPSTVAESGDDDDDAVTAFDDNDLFKEEYREVFDMAMDAAYKYVVSGDSLLVHEEPIASSNLRLEIPSRLAQLGARWRQAREEREDLKDKKRAKRKELYRKSRQRAGLRKNELADLIESAAAISFKS